MRDLAIRAIGCGSETESVRSYNGIGVYDTIITNYTIVVNFDSGIKNSARANADIISNKHLGINLCSVSYACAFPDCAPLCRLFCLWKLSGKYYAGIPILFSSFVL